MRARSAKTGAPPMFLPSASGSAGVRGAEGLRLEQLAQVAPSRAARWAARCRWRCGRERRRRAREAALMRAGDVVGEPDDARRLDAARRLELEQRDDGAGLDVLDLALDAEVGEHARQQPRLAAQLGLRGVGAGLALRAPSAGRAADAGRRPCAGRGCARLRLAAPRAELGAGQLGARACRGCGAGRSAWRSRWLCDPSGDRSEASGPRSACLVEVGRLGRLGLDEPSARLDAQHRRLAIRVGCRARRRPAGSARQASRPRQLSAPAGQASLRDWAARWSGRSAAAPAASGRGCSSAPSARRRK